MAGFYATRSAAWQSPIDPVEPVGLTMCASGELRGDTDTRFPKVEVCPASAPFGEAGESAIVG